MMGNNFLIQAKKFIGKANKSFPRTSILLATAAVLGSAAVVVHKKKVEAERENPPAGKFIDVDGVRLHYVERGAGPTLVLLHGNLVMSQDFTLSALFELAAASYRVIVFDRPGFGYSERPRKRIWTAARQAELLHQALLQLGVERPYVMGHSWGASVALELALLYPTYIAGVVLASGYYYPTFRLDPLPPSLMAIPGPGDLMRHTISPLFARALWPATLRLMFGPAEIPASYDDFPVWLALRPSQLRATGEEGALMMPTAFALENRLQGLSIPTMILAGEEDRYLDTGKESVRLHREVPGSQLRVIKGAGHMVHHAAPQEVMDAINDLVEMSLESNSQETGAHFPASR